MTQTSELPEYVIERYCTCGYAVALLPDGTVDEASRVLTYEDPECKLHSPDPKYDLPEGVL